MSPTVSVVLPTHDRLPYVREAVGSVRAQTFPDWELIVVDDASTDGTATWLRSLEDPRIMVVRVERSGRPSHLRNIGLERARGRWIAFLDSDDRWQPEKLERQVAYHDSDTGYRWSYTGRSMIDAQGAVLPDERFVPWKPVGGEIFEDLLELRAMISLPTVMAEAELLRDVGGFDEGLAFTEDYDLWVRLAEREPCGVLAEPLTAVRVHPGSFTHDRPGVNAAWMEIYRRVQARSPRPAVRRTCRRRRAHYAVHLARQWAARRRYGDAAATLASALRARPFYGAAWRGVIALGARIVGLR